ncbi:Uncharacterized protein PECH_006889 [Penicillium ucsense]|uniref:Uncharacterized protein n=1 Tax=Penicillium ucsense TaxID=2839758 RepID=A0A8J8WM52_9EURO|nr:Uncharacterized protein PECM_004570 [Penicillium ucsense]KAF7738934.1 Uncharacterized protein PECH_006889 [Penicillium ucsense]
MPPRTRSKPFGPGSPNAVQGLPDPAPRRRRATRSVSAQPQDAQPAQPAQPVREPKTRKTRGKASSRGRKKVARRASPSDSQQDQLDDAALSSGAVAQTQNETDRQSNETQDAGPAPPSPEVLVTVLPSIENSETEATAPATGVCESPRPPKPSISSPGPILSPGPVPSPGPVLSLGPIPPPGPASGLSPAAAMETGRSRRGWLMTKLQKVYRLCTIGRGALSDVAAPGPDSAASVAAYSPRRPQHTPMLNFNIAPAYSALEDLELINLLCAARSLEWASKPRSRRASETARLPSPSQSRVLRAQRASPIRRTRTPHLRRLSAQRMEDRDGFGRTLFRLPALLSSRHEGDADSKQDDDVNPAKEREHVDAPASVTAAIDFPPPTTPERGTLASLETPQTAPAAAVNGSSGWSRWIFNGVSRRWTVLRGRLHHGEDDGDSQAIFHDNDVVASEESATPFSAGSQVATSRYDGAKSPETTTGVVDTMPAVSASFPAPTVSIASRAVEKISNILSPRRIQSRPSSPGSDLPRRRRRASSFIDARTLLNPDAPTSGKGYEDQHTFVKRRQAARLAMEKEQRDVRNREIKKAQLAEAAAREIARQKAMVEAEVASRPAIPYRRHIVRPIQSTHGKTSSESNPRKRNRGFGVDEDDLAVHEEDFTPEEWNSVKRQVEEAEQEAAKAAHGISPPTKKRRVDSTSQQQKRTRQSDYRSAPGSSRQAQPPIRTPGFVPNRRGTYAPPDLSPIDSSQLMSESDFSPAPQEPQSTADTSANTAVQSFDASNVSTSTDRAPSGSQKGMMINGVFVPESLLPYCNLDAAGPWRRIRPSPQIRQVERNRRPSYFTFLTSFGEALGRLRRQLAGTVNATMQEAHQRAEMRQRLEAACNRRLNEQWLARQDIASSSGSVVKFKIPEFSFLPDPSPKLQAFNAAATSSSNARIPLRSCLRRKRETVETAHDKLESSPDLPTPHMTKRRRGFYAPDPYASSTSPTVSSSRSKKTKQAKGVKAQDPCVASPSSPLAQNTHAEFQPAGLECSPFSPTSPFIPLSHGPLNGTFASPSPPHKTKQRRRPQVPALNSSSSGSPLARKTRALSQFIGPRRFPSSPSPHFPSLDSDRTVGESLPSSPPVPASRLASSRGGPYQGIPTDRSHPNLAPDNDTDPGVDVDDGKKYSPLTRARNKAEQFKPKTPSRLRESARFPGSNNSTPSLFGASTPSFNGVSLNGTPDQSDTKSLNSSSFVANTERTPEVASTTTLYSNARASSSAGVSQGTRPAAEPIETEELGMPSIFEDVAWLAGVLPDGDFHGLPWPEPQSLMKQLVINQNEMADAGEWQRKRADVLSHFENLFEQSCPRTSD